MLVGLKRSSSVIWTFSSRQCASGLQCLDRIHGWVRVRVRVRVAVNVQVAFSVWMEFACELVRNIGKKSANW